MDPVRGPAQTRLTTATLVAQLESRHIDSAPTSSGAPVSGLSAIVALVRLWLARLTERRRLSRELPSFAPEVLADFGLTREEAKAIAEKPFWQA